MYRREGSLAGACIWRTSSSVMLEYIGPADAAQISSSDARCLRPESGCTELENPIENARTYICIIYMSANVYKQVRLIVYLPDSVPSMGP